METIQQKITKDMPIAEVVSKYPEVVETLLSTGVHCIGCHVSQFETLEQGLMGHGMPEKQINEIIKSLNEVLQKSKENIN